MSRLRIAGGSLRNRYIEVPDGPLRPTQEMARQGMFSTLQAAIPGARVLDLFAGTGALGLEAWSRGAAEVWWVEQDPRVFAALQANVTALCGPAAARNCARSDVPAYLAGGPAAPTVDIVLADPPYDAGASGGWLERLLTGLDASAVLRPGGLLAFETNAEATPEERPGWDLLKTRRYGKTRLHYFRRQKAEG